MSADEIRYEKTDARVSPILKAAVGLLIFTIVSAGAAWAVMYGFREHYRKADPALPAMAVNDPARLPPEPRLQIHPTLDAAEMVRDDKEQQDGYGWVDPARGAVRIPVARAMELLVERGVPTRAAAPVAPSPATAPRTIAPPGHDTSEPGSPAMVQEPDSPIVPDEPGELELRP